MFLTLEVVSKPVDLVHSFMKYCHDANVTIGEFFPIHEMLLVTADIPFNAEFCRDWTPGHAVFRYGGETREEAPNVLLGLRFAPGVARVAVDFV
jgi:hypothetical protein